MKHRFLILFLLVGACSEKEKEAEKPDLIAEHQPESKEPISEKKVSKPTEEKPIGIEDLAREAQEKPKNNLGNKAPKGSVKIQEIDILSEECGDGVRKVVRKYAGQLRYCYEQGLYSTSALNGKIVVDLELRDGRVLRVAVSENSTGDGILSKCIQNKIKRWRFPVDCTGTSSLPFVFTPK